MTNSLIQADPERIPRLEPIKGLTADQAATTAAIEAGAVTKPHILGKEDTGCTHGTTPIEATTPAEAGAAAEVTGEKVPGRGLPSPIAKYPDTGHAPALSSAPRSC